jgi:hypothetical protein
METEPMKSLTEPVYNGMRGPSKIRGDIDVDVAKSTLQKAIRRGDVSLAWTMALRLNEFLEVDEGKGKPVRSNMLNRLAVIAGEDIGMADMNVVMMVDEYVNKIRKDVGNLCNTELIECVAMMCLAKKSRLTSHVNAVFYQAISTPEYFEVLESLRPNILDTMTSIESKADAELTRIKDVNNYDGFLIGRCRWLLENAKTDDEKMSTFFYMRHLLNSVNKYKIPRGYPKKRNILSEPIYIFWNDMLDLVSDDDDGNREVDDIKKEVLELCYKMFLNENERHIYLTLGLFVFFFFDEIDLSEDVDIDAVIKEHGGVESILERAKTEKIVIPDYAVDVHTKKGRSKGKDSVDFAVEGAVVENESEWIKAKREDGKSWKDLGEIYVDFRKFCPKFIPKLSVSEIIESWSNDGIQDSSSKKKKSVKGKKTTSSKPRRKSSKDKKMITVEKSLDGLWSGELTKEEREKLMDEDTPRGQILTSSWKKYVYMPEGSEYVYKGPWKTGVEKLRKLKFRFEVCEYFSSKVLKGEILLDDEKSLWMRFPSLTNVDSSEWTLSDIYDKISDQTVKVVDRSSLGLTPVSKLEDEEIQNVLFEDDLYCDFLLLYILGVGDAGLYNVMRTEDSVKIIDIDDDTTKEEFSELWDIFARKPAGKVVKIIEEGVKENKEKISEYLEDLQEKMEEIIKMGEKNGVTIDEEELKNRIENVKKIVLK